MPNRLAVSTSPYLQQHAQNPVDWYEWGDEAFAEARRRDVPLLLSVGYAACHWCHVMAHESFEDEATARFMNAHFVNIKVDREERPDVDAVYLAATQAMTGHGGWPMTVFATPAGEPFFCGTYFPPVPAHGMPSFGQVLTSIAAAWADRRGELDQSAAGIRAALAGPQPNQDLPHGRVVDRDAVGRALGALGDGFDTVRGGFGSAPKFPPSMLIEWLLRHHSRTGSAEAATMAAHTLTAMARGGLYDQLGGGFARYSVDAGWVVPHFEKMLYDNALLLRAYTHWWQALTADPHADGPTTALARRVVTETADWLLRELRTPEGGFASSLDADSLGPDGRSHEGAFYVWTPEQLLQALGPDDGAWAARVWSVTTDGTFEHGASVLQLLVDPAEAPGSGAVAAPESGPRTVADARYAEVRERLLAARANRPRPARDDKVVAGWNGLAIAALADAGAVLDRPDWVAAATTTAQLLVDRHLTDAAGSIRLARTSRDGVTGPAPGVLEDYAGVAEGLLALYRATGQARWLELAGTLLGEVLDRFGDDAGGYFDTASDQTDPVLATIRRPREVADGPTPSGQALAAGALLTYAALTGSDRHRTAAEHALTEPLLVARQYPRAAGWALAVAEALLDGPREIVVVGPTDDPRTAALRHTALRATAPGAVLATTDASSNSDSDSDPDSDPGPGPGPDIAEDSVRYSTRTFRTTTDAPGATVLALLADRVMVGGAPTAYVCRGFVCDSPTTDPAQLAAQLRPSPPTPPSV